jgi:predicted NBD/HSP70 family sugar kinase
MRRVRDAIASGQRSTLSPYRDQLSVRLVVEAARSGDAVAQEALAETGRWLGIGIASLINALSPEHLVFGGAMSLAYDMLLPAMRAEIEQRALGWIWDNVTLSTATYNADATVMGGIAMIHRHVINHPMSWNRQVEAISK